MPHELPVEVLKRLKLVSREIISVGDALNQLLEMLALGEITQQDYDVADLRLQNIAKSRLQ